MITNQKAKKLIQETIENLLQGHDNLFNAISEITNSGMRIDIDIIKQEMDAIRGKLEDIIYDTKPDIDVYELLTKEGIKVARFSQVNSQI